MNHIGLDIPRARFHVSIHSTSQAGNSEGAGEVWPWICLLLPKIMSILSLLWGGGQEDSSIITAHLN